MPSSSPLGASAAGSLVFGGVPISRTIARGAIPVHFTVSHPTGKALPVNYSVQMLSQNTLTIGYWTALPALGFTINGASVPGPQHIVYNPRTSVGTDVTGIAIVQGSTSIIWQYDVLTDTEIASLMRTFNPQHPQVTITYPNELGFWVQKVAYFQNFNPGTRQTVLHTSVALTFTGILPD